MSDSTRRFSSRVDNYVKYRPSYPPEVVGLLAAECGLTPGALVADIGAGTGLLAERQPMAMAIVFSPRLPIESL